MQSWLAPPMPTSSTPRGRALTAAEWVGRDEDEGGELVDGHLEDEEVPDFTHELVISWLIHVVRIWLDGRGFVVGSESKVLLGPRHGRKPDCIIYLPDSPPPPRRGPLTQPPDVLVEVVTPTPRDERRDRIIKMAEYATFGVPWYWLVDPALTSVEIFERDAAGRYARVAAVTEGRLEVPGCPGLVLDVDGLWAELGRLGDASD